MTDIEILRKVIEKAKKAGYLVDGCRIKKYTVEEYSKVYFICDLANKVGGELYTDKSLYEIIFSRSFARAFFGEGTVPDELLEQSLVWNDNDNERQWNFYKGKLWQWHLQQMVLEENPLQYLLKFLDEEEG